MSNQTPHKPRDYIFHLDVVEYLGILKAQWRFVATFVSAAILTSIALTYIASDKYLATTTLYYRPADMTLLRERSSASFGGPVPPAPYKIIHQTLHDLATSEALIRPVVAELKLDQKITQIQKVWYKRWYQVTKNNIKEWLGNIWQLLKYGRLVEDTNTIKAIKGLHESIEVASTRDSFVFILSVKDKYPERAAMIVDRMAMQLEKWARQQDQVPADEKSARLGSEISGIETDLATLRRQREGILRSNGITSLNEEINTGVQTLYGLKTEYERALAEIQEKQKRLGEIKHSIETRRQRYIDPDHVKRLEEERLINDIELKASQSKRDSIQSSIDRMQSRLQGALAIKKQIDEIDARLETKSRINLHVNDIRLEAEEARHQGSELKIMHKATVPIVPIQPIKIYHVALSAILSLIASIGLVYVLAFFNVRIFFSSSDGGLSSLGLTENADESGKV